MNKSNWNELFVIMDGLELTNEEAQKMFGPIERLEEAQKLRKDSGIFEPSDLDRQFVDLEHYRPLIEKIRGPKDEEVVKKQLPSQKRGRKTHKIRDAYEAIPYEHAPVEVFRKAHNVSVSVLRRHKHFDHAPELGKVNVRLYPLHGNDKEKVLCIWRDRPEQE